MNEEQRLITDMTIDEMREESAEIYQGLSNQRIDDPSGERQEHYLSATQRWQALDAEVHRRMMDSPSLEGAIYRANGGHFLTAPKRTI